MLGFLDGTGCLRGVYINISLNMTQFPKILLVSKKIPDGVQRLIKGI